MGSLSHALHSIITGKFNVCCLCFKTIEDNPVNIQDEVGLKGNNSEKTIKLLDVLLFVLGYETCYNVSALEILCKQCVCSIVTCYKFMSTSKENSDLLSKALCSLSNCLDNSNDNYFEYKTLFVTLERNTLATQQYYDNKHPVTSTSMAYKRFKSMFDIHQKALKNETAVKKEREVNVLRKKRRDYFSLPLKTSDMLYDKNDRNNLKCKCCLKIYPSLSSLRNHFIRVHAPKDYKCSICERKFGSIALLESHKSQSHCTLVCSECGKTFHNRHTLKMHEIGHYLKLVCQDCGRVYKSQTTFKKHIDLNICAQKTRASPADAKFTCDYCNKKYTQKVSLRVHIQYEHGTYKGHECKWCKKKFWAQSRLKAHIVKHTQEKKFQCSMCGGKFVSKESLLYHTRTHTGEKPYKCDFCDGRFLSASRKADHTKRHHSDATFQCDICNIKYTTQLCLEKHKKTHEESDKLTLHLQIPKGLSEEDQIFLEVSDDDYNIT